MQVGLLLKRLYVSSLRLSSVMVGLGIVQLDSVVKHIMEKHSAQIGTCTGLQTVAIHLKVIIFQLWREVGLVRGEVALRGHLKWRHFNYLEYFFGKILR